MKTFFAIPSFVILLLALPATASACMTFSDCEIGSKCVKRGGNIYGVCKGGMSPGNAHDKRPVYDPMDPDGTYGDACTSDVNCGIASRCARRHGAGEGTCVRR